ncbi:hypothetical protein HPB49_003755 [Dermacentor silvarum]|uniref:Uncharacterized protein n=1 Tax=Dermacentor silvarum TaxID=543639 RepID=A0ACB8DTA6_DERSI|nr:hypothetical protein HPB49_003755 [Dermacentor silvarum]
MKRRQCYLDCGGNSGVADLPKTTRFRLMGTPSCDPLVTGAPSASAVSVSTATPLPQQPDCDTTPLHSLDTNGRAAEFGDDGQMEDELFSQFSDTVSGDAANGTDQFFCSGDQSGTETAYAEVDGDHEVDARNSLPPQDLLALTVNFAIEFWLSWNGLEALQKLNAYVLDRNDVPATKYLFKKYVGAGVEAARFHFYCTECLTPLAETSGKLQERNRVEGCCSVCHKNYSGHKMLRDGHFFLTLPLEQQLGSLLADTSVAAALSSQLEDIAENRDNSQMSDLTDGQIYKDIRATISRHDLTLLLNVDGAPIFKSSKYSIWPIQVTINELPPHLRSKNVLIPALWYGQSHADMTLFVKSFVEQMIQLETAGFTWKAGSQSIHSKVIELT